MEAVKRILDRLNGFLFQPERLGILLALSDARALTFGKLRNGLGLTDGNLFAHLQKLRGQGFVEVCRQEEGNRLVSVCRLTLDGAKALGRQLDCLADLVKKGDGGRAR